MPAGSENEPQSTVATPMVEKVGVTGFDFTMANLIAGHRQMAAARI
jgi:hypothetical protein